MSTCERRWSSRARRRCRRTRRTRARDAVAYEESAVAEALRGCGECELEVESRVPGAERGV